MERDMERSAASIAAENRVRLPYVLEALERRRMWAIAGIDATAGLPINGPVATGLVLPANASGPDLMNITLNGQYDYTPTAVKQADGTYTLYTDLVPQHAGKGELAITYRNETTGGWDGLESAQITVKANHFSAVVADDYQYNVLPGTQWTTPVTTLETSSLTQALDQYDVRIAWFGQTKTGRLEKQADGTVGVFVDDGYLPTGPSGAAVSVNIRLKSEPADGPLVGYAVVNFDVSGGGIGIGTFHAQRNAAGQIKVFLPDVAANGTFNHFSPVTDATGWPSTFTVSVLFQLHDTNLGEVPGTVVRESDGSHSVRFASPDFQIDGGMVRITETVHRPAIGATPAATYDVQYVGSYAGGGDAIEDVPEFTAAPPTPVPPTTPDDPTPVDTDPADPVAVDPISGGPISIDPIATDPGPVITVPVIALPVTPTPTDGDGGDVPTVTTVVITTPPHSGDPTNITALPVAVVLPVESKPTVDPLAASILSNGEDTLFGGASDDSLVSVVA